MPQRMVLEFVIDSKGNLKAFTDAGKEIEGVGKSSKETSKGMGALQKAAGLVAGAFAAVKTAQVALDFVKFGAQVQATRQRFEAFAGGTEQAAQYLRAFQEATDGTVDQMGAMAGASRMLQMGLVSNADEMEVMAAIAVKLGDQTMDAGSRVADFSALLANQSIPRLDNFGISSGRVRARIEELQDSIAGLSREEAFKIAVLEEGQKSLDILGDQSGNTATQIAQLEAAVKDAKSGIAEMAVAMLGGVKGTEELASRIRTLPTWLKQAGMLAKALGASMADADNAQQAFTNSLKQQVAAQTDFKHVSEEVRYGAQRYQDVIEDNTVAFNQYTEAQEGGLLTLTGSTAAHNQYEMALQMTRQAEDDAAWAAVEHERALEQERQQLLLNQQMAVDFATSYTMHYQTVEDSAARFTERRENLEREHAERIEDLHERSQGHIIEIDLEHEQRQLAIMQERLAVLLDKQSKFNEDTTTLEQLRTEEAIANLETEIAEKTTRLEGAKDGYMTIEGEYVAEKIAAEEERYATELDMLETEQAKQEDSQKQALGRLMLQHYEAWATMNGVTADEMLKMRLEIMEKYGLITDHARQKAEEQARNWAAQLAIMRGEATSFFDYYLQQLNRLPRDITIRIREELTRVVTEETRIGGELRQSGGYVQSGDAVLVGEMGPELVSLPRGSYVHKASDTRGLLSSGGSWGCGVHLHLHLEGAIISDERAMDTLVEKVSRRKHELEVLAGSHRYFGV